MPNRMKGLLPLLKMSFMTSIIKLFLSGDKLVRLDCFPTLVPPARSTQTQRFGTQLRYVASARSFTTRPTQVRILGTEPSTRGLSTRVLSTRVRYAPLRTATRMPKELSSRHRQV